MCGINFCHVHVDGIQVMVQNGAVNGIDVITKVNVPNCRGCIHGKSARAPIPQKSTDRCRAVLDLVHSDVCGPLQTQSLGGSRYFISFIDDHSRYCWLYAIRAKSEVFFTFRNWMAMVEKQHRRRFKVLQSENGGEYLSNVMKQFLHSRGIVQRLTTLSNPHQNGIAERLNRTLIELVRAMLFQKGLSKSFLAGEINGAGHIRNRVTKRGLSAATTSY